MDIKLLEILCCPSCAGNFHCNSQMQDGHGFIEEGMLLCKNCKNEYPIIRSIPRFVETDNYASSFGYQWNLFKYTQVDQYTNVQQSEQRFFSETQWSKEKLKNNWVLEVGCGNGRFLDVCSRQDCEIVGVDISSAIDAANELFKNKKNVHLIQASIYALPFKKEVFDKCYSIGVIQHTPDPKKSIKTLPQFVKKGGEFALTIYERKPWTLLYAKYLVRPITKRMNKKLLLALIKAASPVLFPLTEVLYRIPIFNRVFKFIIPYANYVHLKDLSMKQRYEWAILDTFDMLSPAYDSPMNEKEVRQTLSEIQIHHVKRLSNPGVNVVARIN